MANLFEAGGAIDNLFDVLRSEIGKADTSVQEWFHDRLHEETNRYNIQRVLWVYAKGVQQGAISPFKGFNDPNIPAILDYIQANVAFDREFIYNVLFALLESAKTDVACASVLAGSGGNFFDDVMNGSVVSAVTGTVNDVFKGLGFPSVANTVVVLGIVAAIGLVIYLKVKK